MGRFLRSKRLRALLWLAAGGKCQACGRDLPEDWEADHVAPWTATHETNVFDMQALCPDCNKKKGARMSLHSKCEAAAALLEQVQRHKSLFRKHQALTADLLGGIISGLGGGQWPDLASQRFLIEEVVPGGGKSYCAVMVASVLVGGGLFDCALWLTPRKSLCQQAKDDFAALDFKLPTGRAFNPFNPAGIKGHSIPPKMEKLFDRNCKVWITSYQKAISSSDIFAQFADSRRVLLIFDEWQLVRDPKVSGARYDESIDGKDGWLRYVDPIVQTCIKKTGFGGVILSGGLSRNDGYRLPYVNYRPGNPADGEDEKREYAVRDIQYTLAEAQADRCIIGLDFDKYKGEVHFEDSCQISQENIESLSDKSYGQKLAYWLSLPDVWQSILHNTLDSLDVYNRERDYKSRYLVIANSIAEATTMTEWLSRNRRNPLLVHSKDSSSHDNLTRFRRHQGDWDGLVTVGMAYIGLNNKDFSHLAYLSEIRSQEWIDQAFHRITRFDSSRTAPGYERQFARFSVPNDPKMVDACTRMNANQNPGVRDRVETKRTASRTPITPDEFQGRDGSITGREFNTNGIECTEGEFIEHALFKLPALNGLTRKDVEEFYSLVKRYARPADREDQ